MKWRSSLKKREELAPFSASNRGAVSVFEFEIEEVYCFN